MVTWLCSCGVEPTIPGPQKVSPQPAPTSESFDAGVVCPVDAGWSQGGGEDGGPWLCPTSWAEAVACCDAYLYCPFWGASCWFPDDGGYGTFECAPALDHSNLIWTCRR
jgi:hypothetical protein